MSIHNSWVWRSNTRIAFGQSTPDSLSTFEINRSQRKSCGKKTIRMKKMLQITKENVQRYTDSLLCLDILWKLLLSLVHLIINKWKEEPDPMRTKFILKPIIC